MTDAPPASGQLRLRSSFPSGLRQDSSLGFPSHSTVSKHFRNQKYCGNVSVKELLTLCHYGEGCS